MLSHIFINYRLSTLKKTTVLFVHQYGTDTPLGSYTSISFFYFHVCIFIKVSSINIFVKCYEKTTGHTLLLLLESKQRAKKVVSDSPGLVDFAIELVNFELNLPDGQVKIFEEFKLKKNCEINSAHQNVFRTRLPEPDDVDYLCLLANSTLVNTFLSCLLVLL